MKCKVNIQDVNYHIDLANPLPIGLSIDPDRSGPVCFHSGRPVATPVQYDGQDITVAAGAPVNFYHFEMIPHGQSTHTECLGHITETMERLTQIEIPHFLVADVITLMPKRCGDDMMITRDILSGSLRSGAQAIVLRTLPNTAEKQVQNYSGSNPPYLRADAMASIIDAGYDHLLIDLPSVDKEQDGGALEAHKIFWEADTDAPARHRTITELIYVPDNIIDGRYILHLSYSPIPLDAVPSWPVLYACHPVD